MKKLISRFIDKSISVLRLGSSWFGRLIAGIVEAARGESYVETYAPTQSDTLHKEIKHSDEAVLKKEFERAIRIALKLLRFNIVRVAIDVTEDPYWGKEGSFNTRAKIHEKSEESWQYANLSIVDPFFVPLMSLPYGQTDDLDNLVIDLLEYLRTLPLRASLVLFDRGFYHARLIDYLENKQGGKPWPYLILVPKNDAMKGYIEKTEGYLAEFKHEMNHCLEKSKWKPITKIVVCKGVAKNKKGEPIDCCFATNQKTSFGLLRLYRKRWNIETGFRIHDEATIKCKSSSPLIRYFYHLVGMLLIIMWRLHNYFKPYEIFKRYLKQLEVYFAEIGQKPPS
ncbi:MAG: transposase [Candidatus Poribacteria bacterium]